MEDSQIGKLVGTTKPTIQSIRNRTHWNISSIQPVDPVALGLCKQMELDAAVRKAAEKKAKAQQPVTTPEERISLMSTGESLSAPEEPSAPSKLAAFENFSLDDPREEEAAAEKHAKVDADSLFNLPKGGDAEDDEDAKA
jgi:hypothetical protein